MNKLQVYLKDYSMMIIDCDRGVAAELSEFFSFFVPGYKFMPAYKNKVWDGKIRLFNGITNELNAGLFVYLYNFCKERNYKLDVVETDYGLPYEENKFDIDELNNMLDDIKIPFPLRDYQYKAVEQAIRRERAILLSPTGSGKSFMIYALVRWILQQDDRAKVLIVVPTTSLVEQLYSDFKDYGWDVATNVHRIYSGKDKNTSMRTTISTWQSIYKFPKQWFEQFYGVFGDECHGFKSKSLSSIMNKATEAKYRFGTTGTLDGTQTHKLVLEGLFGPVFKVTSTKELQDNDTLAPLDINVLLLNYPESVRQNFGKQTYQQEIDFIVKNKSRNNLIRNLALDRTGNTLVLFQLVEKHGKVLYDLISSKAELDRKVFFVSGAVGADDREAIRKIVEKQSNAIIVASMGTFSTGINIKNLHNIIFASPSKSQIRVLQSIGRGLRKSDDGSTTQLFDVADDLHWKGRQNFTLLHSAERVKIYNKEQFKFKIVKVDINE
jgi:superfamily II DNA or RNA helicase